MSVINENSSQRKKGKVKAKNNSRTKRKNPFEIQEVVFLFLIGKIRKGKSSFHEIWSKS
jgi:hypothetical protein